MSISDNLASQRHNLEGYIFFRRSENVGYFLTNSDVSFTVQLSEGTYTFEPAQLSRAIITRNTDANFDNVDVAAACTQPFATELTRTGIDGITLKIITITTQTLKSLYKAEDYDILFYGNAKNITRQENTVTVSFAAWNKILDNSVPTFQFSRTCNFQLFDQFTCKADRSLFSVNGNITAIAQNRWSLSVTLLSGPPNAYFKGGVVQFGGTPRAINLDDGSGTTRTFWLIGQVPSSVNVGDGIIAIAGCDRNYASPNGCLKFANQQHFGGFPAMRIKSPTTDNIT